MFLLRFLFLYQILILLTIPLIELLFFFHLDIITLPDQSLARAYPRGRRRLAVAYARWSKLEG